MRIFTLAFVLFFVVACAHLPSIEPASSEAGSVYQAACQAHFPEGRWQLQHTIHARFSGGRQSLFTGVTVLSSEDRSIHCVLMTLEGMVLFEAVDNGHIRIRRAIGPFENEHFAHGVMNDIRFLFFQPRCDRSVTGTFDTGAHGCRYNTETGDIVDLIQSSEGGWQMHQYDSRGKVLRELTAEASGSDRISPRMVLKAGKGAGAYRLTLTLVEAVRL